MCTSAWSTARAILTMRILTIIVFSVFAQTGIASENLDKPLIEDANNSSSNILGRPLSATEISALDTHIFPDGKGLPEGSGDATSGESLYKSSCASCHGSSGEGGSAIELKGDRSLLNTEYPDKGIAVYWPYAPTLFAYIQRSMPPEKPYSFSNDELYSLVAYVLHLNDLVDKATLINKKALSAINMPNRNGFTDIEAKSTW